MKEHSNKSLSKNTEGVRDAVYARDLRRSKYVIKCFYETYAREDKNDEDEEEILNFSYQFTSTIPQPSSTQQSLSQQLTILLIIINPEIIVSQLHMPIILTTLTKR
ncbi:hypothetical protein C1645_828741 [Glomus cerebriforme]|uniref:Uncharacterized protein n=1 Tax=Glomus cerebriforme TaxID=658196 RepID=A0A397SKQ2_9GLOM|nr:hypothetical protein C1645_828741 [Glomus cerebriforme]